MSNGKQALALVARTLRARGTRTVLMPRYRCEAMAVPFALEGMRVLPVDVGADLLLDPCVLSEALDRAPGAAVVHCETYGNHGGQELTSALAIARMRGSAVILDATHSLVDRLLAAATSPGALGEIAGGSEPWDAIVASTRKLLPVPDGAWLAWSESSSLARDLRRAVAELPGRNAVDEHCTALGIELGRVSEAMRASLGSRREELRIQVCAIADRHERAIETALAPVPASARTIALLEALDPGALQLRAHTARRLRECLTAGLRACGLRVVNPRFGGVRGSERGHQEPGRDACESGMPEIPGISGIPASAIPARTRRGGGGPGPLGTVGAGELAGPGCGSRHSPMAEGRHRAHRRSGAHE